MIGSTEEQAFLNYIKADFFNQNIPYTKPLLFDMWWIDIDGNNQAIVKAIEIIVYLSQANRYPKALNNIKIIPNLSKHLLSQHTAILKWIKYNRPNIQPWI